MPQMTFIKTITITKKIKCPRCGHIVSIKGKPLQKIIVTCPKCRIQGSFVIPSERKQKMNLFDVAIPGGMIGSVLFLAHFLFHQNEVLILGAFLVLLPLFFLLSYDGRSLFLFALMMLIMTIISLSFYNDEVLAQQLIIYVYWLLVVGVLCQLINYYTGSIQLNIRRMFG